MYFVGDTFASVKIFIIDYGKHNIFLQVIISLKICSYFYADTTSIPAVKIPRI